MQTMVAKGVAMSKFCSDPNKNAIFFILMKVLTEKIFEYDKGENKDHIFSIFQIWQNLQFYKKILCKTTLIHSHLIAQRKSRKSSVSYIHPLVWGVSSRKNCQTGH